MNGIETGDGDWDVFEPLLSPSQASPSPARTLSFYP